MKIPHQDLLSFPPLTPAELQARGWREIDILLVTGDAFVDHPSFGTALLARWLMHHGFKVGILAQPLYPGAPHGPSLEQIKASWMQLGVPRLMVGISTGVVDSMLNNYTANKKVRHGDEYTTPDYRRPDHAGVVLAQVARTIFPQTLIVGGGVEISLRRTAHYDYWQIKVLPSIMHQAPYDLLLYGMGESSLLATAQFLQHLPADLSFSAKQQALNRWAVQQRGTVSKWPRQELKAMLADASLGLAGAFPYLHLPSFKEVKENKKTFLRFSKLLLKQAACPQKILIQDFQQEAIAITPPTLPLTSQQLDQIYELPFTRRQHWSYPSPLKSLETVKWSVCINRGCFGGCKFCALTLHQGKRVQSRSADSILREIKRLQKMPGFTGIISDVGGPTANMYQMQGRDQNLCTTCERSSCLFPNICPNLNTSHHALTVLLKSIRALPGIKKVLIASGVRYDLALQDEEFLCELITYHVGGHLKVAPEHCANEVLKLMGKPSFALFEEFRKVFAKISQAANKEQYLVPYFISAYPGCTPEMMGLLENWCKKEHWNLQQVQSFIPLPMTMAAAYYWCGMDDDGKAIYVPKSAGARFAQRAALQPQRYRASAKTKAQKRSRRP
ncbi:MAG: YgiQ family radical SAM protein [Bacteriovoracaceae bacterium]|nr:YgiQ family radical SAM protein [Bacteriovoracaceae bacterium]